MQRLVHLFFSLNRSMVILFSFAAVIMVGTVLLMLPVAHNNGQVFVISTIFRFLSFANFSAKRTVSSLP
ncbi:MAG: hypothetical protein IJW91_01570, partial [Phascolarctobacterium sp.]|nr:hypothetical protein [Phascolarctobacterium sp.]